LQSLTIFLAKNVWLEVFNGKQSTNGHGLGVRFDDIFLAKSRPVWQKGSLFGISQVVDTSFYETDGKTSRCYSKLETTDHPGATVGAVFGHVAGTARH
jgi:hypothetical protein